LKEEFPDFYPQILQVDPYGTNHGTTVAIGAKVDALLKIPDLAFFERSARGQCLDGGEFFRRENINIWDPFENDSNRTTGGAHSTVSAGVQLHQLNHGKTLPHPALSKTLGVNESLEPASQSTG
jgi:hypothetical protein